jgi:hypothetical protein
MIATAPLSAAHDLVGVKEKVTAFIVVAKAKAADGITLAEFAELAVALLRVVMAAIDAMPESGAAKKAMALDAVAMLFDAVADKAVPTLMWPVWLLVRGAVRELVLLAASGAIESLLPLVRRTAQ